MVHINEERAVALGHLNRLDNEDVGGKFHQAASIARGFVRIKDHRVEWVGRIYLAEPALELLVRAAAVE